MEANVIAIEDIEDGDIIKILGEELDEEGNYKEVYWYGEKVGITDEEGLLEVYIIQEPPDGHAVVTEQGSSTPSARRVPWTYEDPEAIHHIPIESVVYHASSRNGYKKAWKQLGFRYVRSNELEPPVFYRIVALERDDAVLPEEAVGIEDSDSDDDGDGSEASIDEEMRDFIVPDDDPESEHFTRASDDSEYTRYTHDSVEKFNTWNPTDRSERKVKDFIDQLETRVRTREDNLRF